MNVTINFNTVKPSRFTLSQRRACYYEISDILYYAAGLDGPAQLAAIKKYAEFTALQK